jgi:hypothetical protein
MLVVTWRASPALEHGSYHPSFSDRPLMAAYLHLSGNSPFCMCPLKHVRQMSFT